MRRSQELPDMRGVGQGCCSARIRRREVGSSSGESEWSGAVASVRRGSFPVAAPGVIVISCTDEGWQAVLAGDGVVAARSLQTLDRRIRSMTCAEPASYQFHTGDAELDRLISTCARRG
jgi:hypothetical protein